MNQQRHIVKQQVIELHIGTAEQAPELQKLISRLYHQRIVPLINQYCTRLSDPDTLDRIDTLELDIGEINPDRLEQEFVNKVEAQLKSQLAVAISGQHSQSQKMLSKTERKTGSQLELFDLFIRTGMLPWWADTMQSDLLDHCLEHLLAHETDKLCRLLKQLVVKEHPVRRLVHSYTDKQLQALLSKLLTRTIASWDRNFPLALLDNLYKSPLLSNVKRGRIRQLMWLAFYQQAIRVDGHSTGVGEFCQQSLIRFAAVIGIVYTSLHDEIAVQIPLLQQDHALHQGSYSKNIQDILADLQRGHAKEDTWKRLIDWLSTEANLADLPVPAQQTLLKLLQQNKSNTAESAILEKLRNELVSVLNKTEPEIREINQEIDQNFSASEQIFVSNAGLVLLWPFLENFFERLDLLENKLFRGEIASQQACLLLQFLVDGRPSAPEFVLTLNKILCGMEADALFEYTEPVSTTEAEECEQLIMAVIGHAAVLNNMSIDGFRNTFLHRQGNLSQRDGTWLLRIERETYDIVLDKFPWSIEWVKLPWMTWPIKVEW